MRILGIDYGRRRIGLALSDASGQLARPWQTIPAGPSPRGSAAAVAQQVSRFSRDHLGEDPIHALVVGLPRRLNGEDDEQTADVRTFAGALGQVTGLVVHLQDERLSSREAEARLSRRTRDWRERKKRIDAAAAAVILQDYLDGLGTPDRVTPTT
jgi:putative pre-16S rRNA nuclease